MTSQQLPERANLEQLKKQAKSLLHAAREGDTAALQRFKTLPAPISSNLALHDAQSVVAREYGFKSWNQLREHVEERSLSFAAAVDEFVRCATGGAAARALRLLALHPDIAHANLYTDLVLGDAPGVAARLQQNPEVVRVPGGPQDWEPLLYVCHSSLHREAPERAAGLVAVARGLLTRGANPNARYHWNWHPELPRTALWGALCAMNHQPLAQALLEGGADPTDGVSAHIAAGGMNDVAALDMLHRFGLKVDGVPGGVPPLRYILSWIDPSGERAFGVRWLLEHGADANLPWSDQNDTPLHVAAQRCDVAMVELLVKHGADIHRRRADGTTPHTLAELHGNREVAAWLLAHGAKDELSLFQRFISACARGDRARADEMLRANPQLRSELRPEHHLMLQVPAERGDEGVLDTMLSCGFNPNARDKDGITILHSAAMAGRPGSVRVLLAHGAEINALDGLFAGTPLVWASEGWRNGSPKQGVDHVATARLLIASGSSLEWVPPEKAPDPERTHEQLESLCRAASAAT